MKTYIFYQHFHYFKSSTVQFLFSFSATLLLKYIKSLKVVMLKSQQYHWNLDLINNIFLLENCSALISTPLFLKQKIRYFHFCRETKEIKLFSNKNLNIYFLIDHMIMWISVNRVSLKTIFCTFPKDFSPVATSHGVFSQVATS